MGRTSVVSSSRRSVSAPTFAASGSARRCKAFSRRRGRPPAQKPSNNNGDYYNNNNNNKDKNNNNEIKKKKETAGTKCGSSFAISLLPARRRILSHIEPELFFVSFFCHLSPSEKIKIASICVLKCPF